MSTTLGEVISQLQQEVFKLKAQVADQSGLADAVRAINNLATAQVRKNTPSLIDVKSLGNSGGRRRWHSTWVVIKESEMMLEWAR